MSDQHVRERHVSTSTSDDASVSNPPERTAGGLDHSTEVPRVSSAAPAKGSPAADQSQAVLGDTPQLFPGPDNSQAPDVHASFPPTHD